MAAKQLSDFKAWIEGLVGPLAHYSIAIPAEPAEAADVSAASARAPVPPTAPTEPRLIFNTLLPTGVLRGSAVSWPPGGASGRELPADVAEDAT